MAMAVQIVGLCLILAFVLLFRDNISLTASNFFGAFGDGDVRVDDPESPSDTSSPEDEGAPDVEPPAKAE